MTLPITRRTALKLAAAPFAIAALPALAQADATLVIARPSEASLIDPHVSGEGVAWVLLFQVYEQLLQADADLKIVPALAASWENPDPLTWVFKLREGAAFSNGRAVTADDVVGSLKRAVAPETGNFFAPAIGTFTSVEAVDAGTVKVVLAAPNSAFLPALTTTMASILPMQELAAGAFDPTTTMLGSGPYMVVEHLQDQSWTMERNPHYSVDGGAKIARVEWRIIPDEAARVAALRTGQVALASFDGANAVPLVSGIPGVRVVTQDSSVFYSLEMNSTSGKSPLSDKRIRRAIALAIDRDMIASLVFDGTVGPDFPVPRIMGSTACDGIADYAMPRAERLAAAQALLAEVGAVPTLRFIATPDFAAFPLIAQVIQSNLAEVGITTDIQQVSTADWYVRVFDEADFDLGLDFTGAFADPLVGLSVWNNVSWAAAFAKAPEAYPPTYAAALAATPGPDRDVLLADLCRMAVDEANILALVTKAEYIVVRDDLVTAEIASAEANYDTFKHLRRYELPG